MANILTLPAELITALIALAGVAISVVAAWLTSRKTLGVEVGKAYWTKLAEIRIATYPVLYSYLSDLSKNAEQRVPSLDELEILRDKVDSWDSKNALVLGKDTVNTCHNFRVELHEAIRQADSTHGSTRPEWLSNLLRQGSALKRDLRSDLGIYGFVPGADGETRMTNKW